MTQTAGRPLHIVHMVPNLNYGGLQEVVRCLALCQRARGNEVSVLCRVFPGNHPEVEEELARAGVSVGLWRDATDGKVASWRKLHARLSATQADIVHIHNPVEDYAYGLAAGRWRRGTKVVMTLHAVALFERFGPRFQLRFRMMTMVMDRLILVCDEFGDLVTRRFHVAPKRLAVVENGIDVSPYLTIPPRQAGQDVVFGAVGRMTDVKNHRLLIEAFARAHARHPDIRLRLLGSGPLEATLKELAVDLGTGDAVQFDGFDHDVAGFLSGLDVFVLPSKSEGLPLSLLEAIASGLPVVGTDVGGVRSVVERTGAGWVCAPDDIDAMTSAMLAARAGPDRRQRAEAARKVAADYYSTDRMTDDYERVYRSL